MVKSYNFPEDLVNRVASAGLYDGQTDEDEIGITYPQLDAYFEYLDINKPHFSENKSMFEIYAKEYAQSHFGLTKNQLREIDRRVITTEHKRKVPPSPNF